MQAVSKSSPYCISVMHCQCSKYNLPTSPFLTPAVPVSLSNENEQEDAWGEHPSNFQGKRTFINTCSKHIHCKLITLGLLTLHFLYNPSENTISEQRSSSTHQPRTNSKSFVIFFFFCLLTASLLKKYVYHQPKALSM